MPPSDPWGAWLQRVLLAPWERWDAIWYLRILKEGYQSGNGTDAFHPLYPWIAWPLMSLGFDPLLALMLVGNLSALAFLLVFERLAALDSTPPHAQTASDLLLFFPVAFILFAPYNEGLFLLLSTLTLFWVRQRRWWRGGMAGALAILTRQQGLFLVFPFAWELWQSHEYHVGRMLRNCRSWLPLGLIPLALCLWVAYRVIAIGGTQINCSSPYGLAYSIFISPSAGKVGASHVVTWPWQALRLALENLWTKPDIDLVVNLVLGTIFLCAVLLAWPRLRPSYRLYVLVIVLISFSYHTGTINPYMGLPRHLFLACPVFIGLGLIARFSWARLLWMGGSAAGSCFLLFLYVLKGWVP